MSLGTTLDEWRRANECLEVAELCLRSGFNADSISRSYYAVFHAATAALRTIPIATKSYRGVLSTFGSNFVRTGLVERHLSSELVGLHDLRESADYKTETRFTQAQAEDALTRAQAFVDRIYPLVARHLGEPN